MEKIKTKIKVKKALKVKPDIKSCSSTEDSPLTYLHCRYNPSTKYGAGWWVNIHKSCFIRDVVSGEKLKLVTAINIPFSPAKHYLRDLNDSLNFVIVFPGIPKHWLAFDFIEGACENDLSSHGIVRNDSGIYKIIVA